MSIVTCPYCKEDIQDRATICKHCRSSLQPTLKEMVLSAITERIRASVISIPTQVSPSRALCYAKFANDKIRLQECLDNCDAIDAMAQAAEGFHKHLFNSFQEYVWGGGDIDPVPFEKFVLERFSQFPIKAPGPRLRRA